MLPNIKLPKLLLILIVVSALWVAGTLGPLLYSELAPTADLSAIVRALEGNENPPPGTASLVEKIHQQGGSLRRAIHVGHHLDTGFTHQNGVSRTASAVSDTYLAWFQNIPRPILIGVRRYDENGIVVKYEIISSDSIGSLAWGYALPLLALAGSILLFRKRRSPLLTESSEGTLPVS